MLEETAVEKSLRVSDTSSPLPTDQASLIVELLAQVHGTFWNRLPRRQWSRAAGVGVTRRRANKSTALTAPTVKTCWRRPRRKDRDPVAKAGSNRQNYGVVAPLITREPKTVMTATRILGNVYSATARPAFWTGKRCGAVIPAANSA